jgi:rubredoxin
VAEIVCTACGHAFGPKPIVYGLPTPETMVRAERGDVILGGCDPGIPVEIDCPQCGAPNEWASRWASSGFVETKEPAP